MTTYSEDFNKAFACVISTEGGYVNDPKDPGGETNFGISKRSYPQVDIKNLTLDAAKAIYHTDFWIKVKGDSIPYPLNLFVFDAAVNQGTDPALKLLQASLKVPADGLVGPATLAAVSRSNLKELSAMFMAKRAQRYIGTRNFDLYGTGWFKRLFLTAMEV